MSRLAGSLRMMGLLSTWTSLVLFGLAALSLARAPAGTPSAEVLQVQRPIVSLGDLAPGTEVEVNFNVKNRSRGEFRPALP